MSYEEFIKQWNDESITYFELTTSGSTGQPKPIQLHKKFLIESAKQTAQALNLSSEKALVCIPANKVGGFMMRVRSVVLGFECEEIEPVSNPMTQLDFDHDYTFVSLIPLQIKIILRNKESRDKLNRFSNILLGGGPIDNTLLAEIELLKPSVYHTYGMTETYSHIALKKLNQPNKQEYFECLPHVQVSLNENSCLCIKSPFYSELIQTNDLAKIHSDGIFEIIGRADFVINSGGIKVIPEQLEELISATQKLSSNFAISSIEDNELGEKIVLVIEDNMQDISSLLLEFKSTLPKYITPKLIVFLDKIPLTETGKINRLQLRNIIKQQAKT